MSYTRTVVVQAQFLEAWGDAVNLDEATIGLQ
jgi:hypothetical protein